MNYAEESLRLHGEWKGKIEITPRAPAGCAEELALAYTPGVAAPCLAIEKDPEQVWTLTRRHNLCAVITDGSAVLGLGDIGPSASMPVMEGKCLLFKSFGDVDAFPICVDTQDVDEFVETVRRISLSFGGINLEDIAAPRCFAIEEKLKQVCSIPIFHDDQHGTAVIMLAGLTNALKVTGRRKEDTRVVISGAGAAATATARLLLQAGLRDIIVCDRRGALVPGREGMNEAKESLASVTNPERRSGTLKEMMVGSDVFLGMSAPGLIDGDDIRRMRPDPIIFACANPTPEIMPENAKAAGAAVVATGRSDYPNQVNNVLAFPGIFRGAFDVRAREINEQMKLAASQALAALVGEKELGPDYILPAAFDPRVAPAVAGAVGEAAVRTGVAQITT